MHRYKTILVDYEGIQECLNTHAENGWRVISVNPDTWRRVNPSTPAGEPVEVLGSAASGKPAVEYCASYYLVVLCRDDDPGIMESRAELAEHQDHPSRYRLPEL